MRKRYCEQCAPPTLVRSGIAVVLMLLMTAPGLAQDLHVRVQHGISGSGIAGYQRGKEVVTYQNLQPRLTGLKLKQGDSICVDVVNAHTVFYGYSTATVVDTTAEKLPAALATIAALLQPLVPGMSMVTTTGGVVDEWATLAIVVNSAPRSTAFDSAVADFYKLMGPLSIVIADVQKEVKRSDILGIDHAKNHVEKLPLSPTADDLKAWLKTAEDNVPVTERAHRMALAALMAYGEQLLAIRAALQKTYPRNLLDVSTHCSALGRGETTVTLKVARKVEHAQRVGETLATVVVDPAYERGFIEAFPLFLVAHADDVPQFALDNGVIVRTVDDDARLYRAGAAMVLNLPGSGEIGYGPAIGFGVATGGTLSLADLFIGGVVSYKDYVRIGIGYGSSQVPSGLEAPAVVGEPLAAGHVLDELITREDQRAWYITIALPKLTLKSPF